MKTKEAIKMIQADKALSAMKAELETLSREEFNRQFAVWRVESERRVMLSIRAACAKVKAERGL